MEMVRGKPLVFNQGAEISTRQLFRVSHPYFMPERLAPFSLLYYHLHSFSRSDHYHRLIF
ncbi:hypothetical protein B9T07_26225 [Limnospira fusiformis CCALA 023]